MEEAWVGEFSRPGFLPNSQWTNKITKYLVSVGRQKERSGKGRPSQTPQSRQTYGRMFNLLSSP